MYATSAGLDASRVITMQFAFRAAGLSPLTSLRYE